MHYVSYGSAQQVWQTHTDSTAVLLIFNALVGCLAADLPVQVNWQAGTLESPLSVQKLICSYVLFIIK